MATGTANTSTSEQLLRHLLAIELWRGGLSQDQIRKRLGISINTVNEMLKGVSRTIKQEATQK